MSEFQAKTGGNMGKLSRTCLAKRIEIEQEDDMNRETKLLSRSMAVFSSSEWSWRR